MKVITTGATRVVILTKKYAFKIPTFATYTRFLHGLLANVQEVEWSKTGYPELCPVCVSLPLGLLVVMPRCEPLTDEQYAAFDPEQWIDRENYILPVEAKQDSFGILNGRIVAVDYGS